MLTAHKTCASCKATKPLTAFYRDQRRRDGHHTWCKECHEAQKRAARLANPQRAKDQQRATYLKYAPARRQYMNTLRYQLRIAALRAYGGDPPACACCGEGTEAFLEIDHIANNGAEHRREIYPKNPKSAGGSQTLRWLRDHGYPPGFQILCANCNRGKALQGVCPHQNPLSGV